MLPWNPVLSCPVLPYAMLSYSKVDPCLHYSEQSGSFHGKSSNPQCFPLLQAQQAGRGSLNLCAQPTGATEQTLFLRREELALCHRQWWELPASPRLKPSVSVGRGPLPPAPLCKRPLLYQGHPNSAHLQYWHRGGWKNYAGTYLLLSFWTSLWISNRDQLMTEVGRNRPELGSLFWTLRPVHGLTGCSSIPPKSNSFNN